MPDTPSEPEHLWDQWFDQMIATERLDPADPRLVKFEESLRRERDLIEKLAQIGGLGVNPILVLWSKVDKLCQGLLGPDVYLDFMMEFTEESIGTLEQIISASTKRRIQAFGTNAMPGPVEQRLHRK